MQNSKTIFFSYFAPQISFFVQICPKNEKCQFKVKIVTLANSNMKNWMMMFIFPVFN